MSRATTVSVLAQSLHSTALPALPSRVPPGAAQYLQTCQGSIHLPVHNPLSSFAVLESNFSELTSSSTETNSKIHRQFRNAHEGHRSHAGLDPTRASTGVVWCTERAYEHGFADEPEKWANLGQGAPEVDDDIEGSFARPTEIDITMAGREYGPTAGIKGLRAAVANLYNVHHRKGKSSLYTWENVGRILHYGFLSSISNLSPP